jgi:hypothetical protein
LLGTRIITPELLKEHNLAEIINCYDCRPAEYQVATKGEIVKNADGNIEQLWDVREMTDKEKVRTWIEGARFFKLLNSDWTQLADCPLSAEEKAAWATYRQALRDITDNIDLPNLKSHIAVPWPTPPSTTSRWTPSLDEPPNPSTANVFVNMGVGRI